MPGGGDEFDAFLDCVKEALTSAGSDGIFANLNGDDWEERVFEECVNQARLKWPNWELYRTKAAEFPDIVVNHSFGIEVKSTKSDHWVTLGNSINESRRIPTVTKVQVLFGKLGGQFEVECKPYEQCLKSIATTHYPRYVVDMKLAKGTSIFERLGLSYEDYRTLSGEERIRIIKDFLRSSLENGEALWWIDEDTVPVIRNFNRLDLGTKRKFTNLAMARCPEIFKGARERGKYDRVAQILLTEFQAVSGNLRDHFSASGQQALLLRDGRKVTVPQMIAQLHQNAREIAAVLDQVPGEDLYRDWEVQARGTRFEDYVQLLNVVGHFAHEELRTGDIFLDGYERQSAL